MSLLDKIKGSVDSYRADQEQKRSDEESRKQKILSGNIEPIAINFNLDSGEKAFLELKAERMALVTTTVVHEKKKGVIGRAVVGGLLLGPLGALGGAATAGSQSTHKNTEKVGRIDSGKLVFTNKRVIFVGKEAFSLPYSEVLAVGFSSNSFLGSNKLELKYQGMKGGEYFAVSGSRAADTELYYKGITTHLKLT